MSDTTGTDHARLMDSVYARQRHIYDLTRKYYLLGRDRAIDTLNASGSETILEVGCGTGRNLIIAAKKYPNAKLYGIDISNEMLETAQSKITNAGLAERITLAQGDAGSFDAEALFGETGFDRVLMSYTLSMIPPWQAAMQQSMGVLNPNGSLVFVDFWDQSGLPSWSKSILKKWLDLFHVEPREALKAEAERLTREAGLELQFEPLYRGYACIGTISKP